MKIRCVDGYDKTFCDDCPAKGTKCKGENTLIIGCCQCLEQKGKAIKKIRKPKQTHGFKPKPEVEYNPS